MVFSFFKKQPEKMVARPAAVPRSVKPAAAEAASASEASSLASGVALPAVPTPVGAPAASRVTAPKVAPGAAPETSDFSDFVFSESSPDFQIEGEIDPVDALAEEAAMLFANAQDDAARAVLEGAVALHRSGRGERLWLMLFDLYRMVGKHAAHEALGIDYAQAFEKSPPGWLEGHHAEAAPRAAADPASTTVLFKGELCAANGAAFDELQRVLAASQRLRVDLTKVVELDAEGCSRLFGLLQQACRSRRAVELLGSEALAGKLAARIECGRAQDAGCWLLYLELCQSLGRHEAFEETAINYAVTFEVSPPSWEARELPAKAATPVMRRADEEAGDGAYALRGEIKATRFADLVAHAEKHDLLLVDCAQLKRIDFISAGALLNVLTTIRRSGKQIVFRHPHHLVAELFAIVGLNAVATFVAEKH